MISFRKLAAIAWAALAAGSFFVSTTALERLPSLCLFQFWFGHSCPGCGMTRALLCAFQGNWARASAYNPLSLPLLVIWTGWLLFSAAPQEIRSSISEETKRRAGQCLTWISLTAVIVVEWSRWRY